VETGIQPVSMVPDDEISSNCQGGIRAGLRVDHHSRDDHHPDHKGRQESSAPNTPNFQAIRAWRGAERRDPELSRQSDCRRPASDSGDADRACRCGKVGGSCSKATRGSLPSTSATSFGYAATDSGGACCGQGKASSARRDTESTAIGSCSN